MDISTITLKDTIKLMLSSKYEERLVAEYLQAKIRYHALVHCVIGKHGGGRAKEAQASAMAEYLNCMRLQLVQKGVNVDAYLAKIIADKYPHVDKDSTQDKKDREIVEEEDDIDEDEDIDLDCIAPGMNKVVEDFFDHMCEALAKAKGEKK